VGGASRNERRRRQEAAAAARKPAIDRVPGSGRQDNRVKVGIIVAVVVVAVIATTFVLLNRPWGSSAQPVAATYPVAVDGVVVAAGQPTAPVTIDVYEDFLCPFCERFETRNRDALTTALNEGRVKVNFHALNILDARTTPPGYSTLAANAALCAVPTGIWPAFHERLFAEQPAEGSAGLTAAQLSAIGTELGAGPAFTQCVESNGNAAAITAATETVATNPALQTDGQFGTPTVAVGGRKIDVSDSDWLQTALAGS
jgi:protein-disulfide isomerase